MITDEELIALEARKIIELDANILQAEGRLRRIKMQLICIGGPLNDNFLQYSKEQLKPFFKIQDILDGCTD